MLLGLLKPFEKGDIIINSLSIEKNLNSWHNYVSYVPQDIFLFNDTIKNNILFGINESEISQNLIEKALEISNLNGFG